MPAAPPLAGSVALEFLTFLGLVLFVEGILLALFPEPLRRMMAMFAERPSAWLRRYGLIVAVLAAGFLFLVAELSAPAAGSAVSHAPLQLGVVRGAIADLL